MHSHGTVFPKERAAVGIIRFPISVQRHFPSFNSQKSRAVGSPSDILLCTSANVGIPGLSVCNPVEVVSGFGIYSIDAAPGFTASVAAV